MFLLLVLGGRCFCLFFILLVLFFLLTNAVFSHVISFSSHCVHLCIWLICHFRCNLDCFLHFCALFSIYIFHILVFLWPSIWIINTWCVWTLMKIYGFISIKPLLVLPHRFIYLLLENILFLNDVTFLLQTHTGLFFLLLSALVTPPHTVSESPWLPSQIIQRIKSLPHSSISFYSFYSTICIIEQWRVLPVSG